MNNKKIFSTDFNMTWDEYKKMMIITPEFYWWNVFKTSIVEIIIILIAAVIYKLNIVTTLIISVITIGFVMILYKVKLEWIVKRYYDYYKKNGMLAENTKVTFFNNFLIKKSNNIEIKINYKQIKKIIETESNFYIYGNNVAVLIKKENCEEKDLEFIRNIDNKIYVRKINYKKEIKTPNKKSNNNLLKLLFFGSIFSFFGSIFTMRTIANYIPSSLIAEKMWVFWTWLPLPILSIIIGYRSKDSNKKAKKNIVFGYAISIFLILFGGFCVVMPVGRISYNKIKSYEDILMVEIPKDGDYIQQRCETYFDFDKKNVIVTEAFFKDSLEVKEFEQKIINGQNWTNIKTISSELKPLIPYQMMDNECKNCYITIYNENTKEYNTAIGTKEKDRMHVALYNMDKNKIEINSYDFE